MLASVIYLIKMRTEWTGEDGVNSFLHDFCLVVQMSMRRLWHFQLLSKQWSCELGLGFSLRAARVHTPYIHSCNMQTQCRKSVDQKMERREERWMEGKLVNDENVEGWEEMGKEQRDCNVSVWSLGSAYATSRGRGLCHRFIYSLLDAVPPIHAESSHVATDKVPSM